MLFRLPPPRQPFIWLAIAAVLGICAADFRPLDPLWAFGLTALGVLAVLLRPNVGPALLLCGLVFFEWHAWRHHGGDAAFLARTLESGPRVVSATGIVWNEPVKPAVATRGPTARFLLKVEKLTISQQQFPARLSMNVTWSGPMPVYGDRVTLLGSADNLRATRNPGQFDFAEYQRRRGVSSEIQTRFPTDCRIESHGHGWMAQDIAFRTSHWIQRQLRVDLEGSPEIADLIASMVLGLRGETPEDMKALFQRTGTMHLFAVSGLNVAMLAGIFLVLARPFGIRRGAAALLVIPILAGYALITGLTPSCVRATIMVSMVLLGQLVDRRSLPLNSLGAAAFFILLGDTEQLFLLGFQFSFILVVTLIWLSRPIQKRLEIIGRPDPFLPRELWSFSQRTRVSCMSILAATTSVTVSAWIGSALFTAGHFHLFSPSTFAANLAAVPLAFMILVLGLASVMAAPVWTTGVVLFNNANWFFTKLLLGILKYLALLPGSYVYVEVPRLGPAPTCELAVFDLADGGATFLRADGRDWLLDCGGSSDYDHVVLPYLRSRGVNRLDGLLLTHGDARHIGGATSTIDDFHPRMLVDSVLRDKSPTRRRLHVELSARGIPKGLYERGDVIHLGPRASLRILYPPAGLRRSVSDDMALVTQLEVDGRRILFMSDSGFSTERWLLENERDLRSDVLVKGQHAKDFSGIPDFVSEVNPQAIVCGSLSYGVPPETLDTWVTSMESRGFPVFRQDRSGAVLIEIRDGKFEMRSFVGGQTFRSRAR